MSYSRAIKNENEPIRAVKTLIRKSMSHTVLFRLLKLHETKIENVQKYRKVLKFSDAKKLCCNQPEIQTKRPNLRVFHQKDANGKQTVKTLIRLLLKEQSDLGLHCLPRPVCPKTLNHYGKENPN